MCLGRIYPPILMNGLLQRREGHRVRDNTQSFQSMATFVTRGPISLCS
eukprot:CCRYP_003851-RA/>CCRYP_003851-RA protein AED:0.23 eAED:0.23 QI:88/1/0.5/1/0/0/2/0/47